MSMSTLFGSAINAAAKPVDKRSATDLQTRSPLHISRRLDWRFLLPDPTLAHVGYLGSMDAELVYALEQFAQSVTDLSVTSTDGRGVRQYDLVIARMPTLWQLQRSVEHVQPGGYLYVETCGLLWPGSLTGAKKLMNAFGRLRLGSPRAHIATLSNLGMVNAATYWFWPNFSACTRMVPLDDPAALNFVFGAPRIKSRLKRNVFMALQRSVLEHERLSVLLPNYAVVANKKGNAQK